MICVWRSSASRSCASLAFAVLLAGTTWAADLPDPARVETVKLLEVPSYCEGVVFDHENLHQLPIRATRSRPHSVTAARYASWYAA